MDNKQWTPSVILVDAGYLDRVAFDLTVNFERIIGRRIPQADLCHWIDCVALDGGLRPGDNQTQVHFLHPKEKATFRHFTPSSFAGDISGMHFSDNLGHFTLFAFPVEEIVSAEEFFLQSFTMLADAKEISRLIVIGDMAAYGDTLRKLCAQTDGKEITLLTMEPVSGQGFRQEILGYSLMSALGIRSEELG